MQSLCALCNLCYIILCRSHRVQLNCFQIQKYILPLILSQFACCFSFFIIHLLVFHVFSISVQIMCPNQNLSLFLFPIYISFISVKSVDSLLFAFHCTIQIQSRRTSHLNRNSACLPACCSLKVQFILTMCPQGTSVFMRSALSPSLLPSVFSGDFPVCTPLMHIPSVQPWSPPHYDFNYTAFYP